jgi:hypothetical protein
MAVSDVAPLACSSRMIGASSDARHGRTTIAAELLAALLGGRHGRLCAAGRVHGTVDNFRNPIFLARMFAGISWPLHSAAKLCIKLKRRPTVAPNWIGSRCLR